MPSISKASLMGAAGNAGGDTLFFAPLDENSTTTFTDRISGLTLDVVGTANTSHTTGAPGTVTRYQESNIGDQVYFKASAVGLDFSNGATLEAFFYLVNSTAGTIGIHYRNTGATIEGTLYYDANLLYTNNGGNVSNATSTLANGTWHHWAILLDVPNSVMYGAIDGTIITAGTAAAFGNVTDVDVVWFGARRDGVSNSNGYSACQLRVSRGLIYDTAGFTAPTPPLE